MALYGSRPLQEVEGGRVEERLEASGISGIPPAVTLIPCC